MRDVEIVTRSELASEAMTVNNDDLEKISDDPIYTHANPPSIEPVYNTDELLMENNDVDVSNYSLNEEETTNKPSKNASKSKRQKKSNYESESESSDSSFSDSDSEEEMKLNKKHFNSKRKKISKNSKKESQIFQKTFMKMMQKTMKSVLAQQMK